MFPRWQIDAVPPSRCDEALLLLVAGAAGDGLVCARMEALRGLLQARGQYPPRIWCARSNRSTLSAAMVMETPGRIGALLFTSPQAAGVNEEALIETITAASRDALAEQGLAFVQAMLDPQEAREIAVVGAAGLDRLAELAHMQLDLTHSPSPWPVDGLTWQRWGEFSERELCDVIASTYVGSMDCPRLSGLRDATEVLESHKSCGVFRPDSWWIARKDGHSVGCVLVNDSASAQTAEVVYIGVVAAHRRQGVGRAMLRRAADSAYRRGRSALLLAVDEQNRSAKALYEAEGFRQTRRQLAFIMTPTEQQNAK